MGKVVLHVYAEKGSIRYFVVVVGVEEGGI